MAVYPRSSRRRFLLVLLLLTAATIVTVDGRAGDDSALAGLRQRAVDAVAPITGAVHHGFAAVGDWFAAVGHSHSLRRENARLTRQLADARGHLAQREQSGRVSEQVQSLEGIPFAPDLAKGTVARVVGAGPGSFESVVLIDVGTGDGVRDGMPVVTGDGLVGRVIRPGKHHSRVLLVTDPSSAVGARLVDSGETAVAQGLGEHRRLRLDLVDPAIVVAPGAKVVTSGIGGRYPAGIPLASVITARHRENALQQEVFVRPAVDVARLDLVRVLPWLPAPVPGG